MINFLELLVHFNLFYLLITTAMNFKYYSPSPHSIKVNSQFLVVFSLHSQYSTVKMVGMD